MGGPSNPNPGAVPERTGTPVTETKTEPNLAEGLVDYATFSLTDLRTGTVAKAEGVPKSDRLLKLEVDFGKLGTRTILAGIAQSYTVESVVGQSVVAVVNLPSRKMMSHESNGMLLAAKNTDGKVFLASCPGVPDGSKLA